MRIFSPISVRDHDLEVWVAAYDNRWKLMPRKVIRITKKFFYFDEENEKDKIAHYLFKNSEIAGIWTSETEAWTHIAKMCSKDLEWAKNLIRDYEFLLETHPEAVI
jgi:hypothetical protein